MKKRALGFLVVILLIASFSVFVVHTINKNGRSTAVNENEVEITGIAMNSTDKTANIGDTTQLTATVSPSNATNKAVTWSSSNDFVAAVSSSGLVTAKAVGTATITATVNDGSGKMATATITVTCSHKNFVNGACSGCGVGAVVITQQPKNVTATRDEKAKVTVEAEGHGLTYHWYYKDTGFSNFGYTDAFSGNKYSVSMTDARDGRQVYCCVYDRYGNMAQSDTVTLTMNAVKITQQPTSVTVVKGATATVSVKASGDGLTYRWYYKDKGSSSFRHTSTFTGDTYSVAMTDAQDGRQVCCRVYDKYGNVVQSNTVTLTMDKVKITEQPTDVAVAKGEMATVIVRAKGDGLTYRWYYKDKGSSSFKYTSTFTGNTYSVSMTDARNGRQVYCCVYDKYGSEVQSNTVLLSMK